MTLSPTAHMLAQAIDESDLTQREIADRVGFKHPNVLSMMKQGLTRVPLARIPALAQTLELDQAKFLLVAIKEYHEGVHDVLCDTLGLPLSASEQKLIAMFRIANLRQEIKLDGPFLNALEGLLELAELARTE